jgi:hypothetical protein
MKNKLFLSLFLISLFLSFIPPHIALAASVTLSGTVTDSSGSAVTGATVAVNDANNDQTTTDGTGHYSLSIPSGTYNIQVAPPAGSNFSPVTDLNRLLTNTTVVNFVLDAAGTTTLKGHVLDAHGAGLSGIQVVLYPSSGNKLTTTTDSSGAYAFAIAAGDYRIQLINSSSLATAPSSLNIISSSFYMTESTILDLPLALKQISIHVQNSQGNAVSDASISTDRHGAADLPLGPLSEKGYSGYDSSNPAKTDNAGNAILWLLPPASGDGYNITVTPPSDSNYGTTTKSNVEFSSSTSVTVTLPTAVTVSGTVLDGLGNSLSGVQVFLYPELGNAYSAFSDGNGAFSFKVSSGNYRLQVSGNSINAIAPLHFDLISSSFTANQDTNLNLQLPVKQVSMHVQDIQGQAISGAHITTTSVGASDLSMGSLSFNGSAGYDTSNPVVTNSSGDATLFLLPTNNELYSFTATPPQGSIYGISTLQNVSITSDQNEVISFQYNHATPVTTSNLATQNSQMEIILILQL